MSKIILTGDRPTGRLHVGHYVGSLKRRVELQNSGEYDSVYIMIADAQALTDNFDNPDKVRSNISEVALDYMSCGLDPAKSTLFVQSYISELTELTFYYANLVTVSRLKRNPTVKSEIQLRGFNSSIPVGFLPIRSVRQLISQLLKQMSCLWARTSSQCWNRLARSCIVLTVFTEKKFSLCQKHFSQIIRLVCAFREPMEKQNE